MVTNGAKYSKVTGCPYCKSLDIAALWRHPEADVMCLGCGAVFYNENHVDIEKAGRYTGRTENLPNETLYKVAEANRVNDKNKMKEMSKDANILSHE